MAHPPEIDYVHAVLLFAAGFISGALVVALWLEFSKTPINTGYFCA